MWQCSSAILMNPIVGGGREREKGLFSVLFFTHPLPCAHTVKATGAHEGEHSLELIGWTAEITKGHGDAMEP